MNTSTLLGIPPARSFPRAQSLRVHSASTPCEYPPMSITLLKVASLQHLSCEYHLRLPSGQILPAITFLWVSPEGTSLLVPSFKYHFCWYPLWVYSLLVPIEYPPSRYPRLSTSIHRPLTSTSTYVASSGYRIAVKIPRTLQLTMLNSEIRLPVQVQLGLGRGLSLRLLHDSRRQRHQDKSAWHTATRSYPSLWQRHSTSSLSSSLRGSQ